MCQQYSDVVLGLRWRCVSSTVTLFWGYVDDVLAVQWRCFGATLTMFWLHLNSVLGVITQCCSGKLAMFDGTLTLWESAGIPWRYVHDVLMECWPRFTTHWRCFNGMLTTFSQLIDDVLTAYWQCFGGALTVLWRCVEATAGLWGYVDLKWLQWRFIGHHDNSADSQGEKVSRLKGAAEQRLRCIRWLYS